jgi:hypothetical protein
VSRIEKVQNPRGSVTPIEKMGEDIHDNGTRLRVSDIMREKMPNCRPVFLAKSE